MSKTTVKPISIERYMHVRASNGAAFSHDGTSLYFLTNLTGLPQVWKVDANSPWPQQITFLPQRVMGVYPSPTKPVSVVAADMGGSERAQLYLLSGDGMEITNITDDAEHIYSFGAWDATGQRFSYSTNRRNGRDFDVYVYNIESGKHQLVHQSDFTNYAGPFSPDGKSLLVSRYRTNLDNDLYLVDIDSKTARCLTEHRGETDFSNPHFSRDGSTLYMLTNRESEFTRVAQLHLKTQSWTWLTNDEWDAESLELSHDGHYLAFSLNVDGTSRLAALALTAPVAEQEPSSVRGDTDAVGRPVDTLTDVQLPKLPAGVISELAWSPAEHVLAITISSPLFATEVWLVNTVHGKAYCATHASNSGVPKQAFVEPELVHYPSFDERDIPAFLYRPQNSDTCLPTVVYVHGGPESQSRNNFNPVIQYFVNQGYNVLVPNVRGSSGYGREYVHLDDVRLRLDSVADLAAGARWLADSGTAPVDKIAVMGGSYGGFMVLAALTHYPSLWAAGIDIVGISNFRTFIENTSPYRRHLRESEYGTIEADGAFFDEISPIHHIHKIQAPLLVIHGANDPRVPIGEAEQMVSALQERHHQVVYLRFEDEGHGIIKIDNKIQGYGRIADFLNDYLR